MKLRNGLDSGYTGSASRKSPIPCPAAGVTSLLLLLLAFGCAETPDERTPTPTPSQAPTQARKSAAAEAPSDTAEPGAPGHIDSLTVRPWSRDGLEAQPRMAELKQRTHADLGYTPGTTIWRAAGVDLSSTPSTGGAAYDAESPDALLARVAAELPMAGNLGEDVWEQTLRIWQGGEDEAVGIIMRWGMKDDSVIGHDHRVQLRRSNDHWHVIRLEERFHCSRGVTDEGLCV